MNPMRAMRRAWAAFLGAVAFGVTFLAVVPPFDSRTTDGLVLWGTAAAGAATGAVLEAWAVRSLNARRVAAPTAHDNAEPSEPLVG